MAEQAAAPRRWSMGSDSETSSTLRRSRIAGVGLAVWLAGGGSGLAAEAPERPEIAFSAQDRILVLAPHPDDEVLGCAGVIQQAIVQQRPLRIVFFTYGDNNQWSFLVYRKRPVLKPTAVRGMGLIRHDEALAAAKVLGLMPEQLMFLGYPDFGTMHIWKAHWGARPPFRSMLTRVTAVPYKNALRPGAPYKGEEVLRDLTTVLREFRPTKIFVSHPGDHMPDHSALYLFTRVALWDLASEMQPEIYPYLVHFKRWPRRRGYRPTELLELPAPFKEGILWWSHHLGPSDVERKRAAIRAHRSQYAVSAKYLLSFMRSNELFGDLPVVPLRAGPSPLLLSADGAADHVEPSEELTDTERAAFVGVEERSVQLVDDQLVLSMKFSRPLAQAVNASVYIFGYRSDRPFAQMPKLHVKFGALLQEVYDQDRKLPQDILSIRRKPKRLTIRVPLRVLGDPQRVLTSARTSFGEVPLDWASWRILAISSDHP